MYLTFDEYIDLGGTIEDETTFNDFSFESESIINWYTFNRIRQDEKFTKVYESKEEWDLDVEAVKRCEFRLIQLARIKAEMLASASGSGVGVEWSASSSPTEPALRSQSNDGVSISYNMLSAYEIFGLLGYGRGRGETTASNEIDLTVKRYLQGVVDSKGRKVLYQGLYQGE